MNLQYYLLDMNSSEVKLPTTACFFVKKCLETFRQLMSGRTLSPGSVPALLLLMEAFTVHYLIIIITKLFLQHLGGLGENSQHNEQRERLLSYGVSHGLSLASNTDSKLGLGPGQKLINERLQICRLRTFVPCFLSIIKVGLVIPLNLWQRNSSKGQVE